MLTCLILASIAMVIGLLGVWWCLYQILKLILTEEENHENKRLE